MAPHTVARWKRKGRFCKQILGVKGVHNINATKEAQLTKPGDEKNLFRIDNASISLNRIQAQH